jgi:hypothetical protein
MRGKLEMSDGQAECLGHTAVVATAAVHVGAAATACPSRGELALYSGMTTDS